MTARSIDLARIDAAEADLLRLSTQVSAILSEPPSELRTQKIGALWSQIAARHDDYAAAAHQVRNSLASRVAEGPLDAARRRDFAHRGPAIAGAWPRVARLIERQMQPTSFPPLVSDVSETVSGPEGGPMNYLMAMLFRLANPVAQNDSPFADTHYGDIPLSGAYFLNLLQAARRIALAQDRVTPPRFLDVGCGGGTKVIAASAVFDVAHGIELDAECVDRAKAFLHRIGAQGPQIDQADALQFDDYGHYDIIYFYRPMKTGNLATQLEDRILSQVSPGTILIGPLNASLRRRNEASQVADVIFVAHQDVHAAQDLAQRALTKGAEGRLMSQKPVNSLGFWDPIIAQSRRNGFDLR